jgi:hypothetical protein
LRGNFAVDVETTGLMAFSVPERGLTSFEVWLTSVENWLTSFEVQLTSEENWLTSEEGTVLTISTNAVSIATTHLRA